MEFMIKGISVLVLVPLPRVKLLDPLPVCLGNTMRQGMASSDPKMEMKPSFGELAANCLCRTYSRSWGPSCRTD